MFSQAAQRVSLEVSGEFLAGNPDALWHLGCKAFDRARALHRSSPADAQALRDHAAALHRLSMTARRVRA